MTPQQNKLYRWLLDRIDDPVGPTFQQMRDAMGFKSKASVHRLIDALVEQRRVTRIPNRAMSIRAVPRDVLHGVSTASMVAELKRRGEWPDVG